jgi:hypothetical protein
MKKMSNKYIRVGFGTASHKLQALIGHSLCLPHHNLPDVPSLGKIFGTWTLGFESIPLLER